MDEVISIDFDSPFPLILVPDRVVLPYTTIPLTIRRTNGDLLITDVLDGPGQIVLATVDPSHLHTSDLQQSTPRPAACLGQVVTHDSRADGHDLLVHGLCRVNIGELLDGDYQEVMVRPSEELLEDPPEMPHARETLHEMLTGPLRRLNAAESILEWFDHPGMHTHALLELVTWRAFDDVKFHYAMLAEPDMATRWELIRTELEAYRRILEMADRQHYQRWPNHISMN